MPPTIKEKKTIKKATISKTGRYIEAIGRRKTATARVRIFEDKKQSFIINERTLEEYFPTRQMQTTVRAAFNEASLPVQFRVSVHIRGGGPVAQSEALRHGIARALVKRNEELRKILKNAGFLKRDPRMKERKKPGLKGARKAPQWSKR